MSTRKPYQKPELHTLTKDDPKYEEIMQFLSESSSISGVQQESQELATSDTAFPVQNHTSEKENRQQ